ncbi:MAG: carbohydrate ABC transporter permease [Saccharofermentanales bacterium]
MEKRNIRKMFRFNNRAKTINRTKTGNAAIFLILGFFGIFSLLPMVLAVSQSVKPLNELFLFPPRIFAQNPTLNNFRQLFSLMSSTWVPFTRYIFNTFFITIAGTVGHIIVASMAAYPLAKLKVPGGNLIFALVITSLMFSPTVSDVANYITMSALHLTDTYLAILIPALGTSLGLFLMRQFMVLLPASMLESARIDGANEFRIFWRIVFPQVKPAWLTLAVFSFQGLWNGTHSTYIYSEQMKTLPYALSQIVSGGIIRAGAGAAVGVIMMIVPITFFILSQNQILETMSASGIKE